jgi:hypothetical protein
MVSKHSETEGQQYMFREKTKEDIQKMWHKADLLLMSKRQRFQKLKENSKLMKPKNEINGTEELLEENNRFKQLDTCSTYNHNRNNE